MSDGPEYYKTVQRMIDARTNLPKEKALPERLQNLITLVENPNNDATLRERAKQELEKYKQNKMVSCGGREYER